jgi:hypothetical protein
MMMDRLVYIWEYSMTKTALTGIGNVMGEGLLPSMISNKPFNPPGRLPCRNIS